MRHNKGHTRRIHCLWVIIILYMLNSCSEYKLPDRVAKTIANAENNSDNLKTVLRHYSQDAKDSLKLRAAYFLIENMDGLITLDTTSTKPNEVYFNLIKASWNNDGRIMYSNVTRAIDSLNKKLSIMPSELRVRYLNEIKTITAEVLINNIEDSFYVWENLPWAKSVTFENFCEYILPYRCTDTYDVTARDFFLERYKHIQDSVKGSDDPFKAGEVIVKDVNFWFKEDVDLLNKFKYLKPIKFSDLLKGKMGPCIDANSVRVTALRSAGVPAALDETPNWGNSNKGHFWYKIIDHEHDTITRLITNENTNRKTQYIISASTFDAKYSKGSPSHTQVIYNRTLPKVFRRSFSIQRNSLAMVKTPGDTVPDYFNSTRLKDVTGEYLETADVSIHLNDSTQGQKYVYLCVFDNLKWLPVAWATIENGRATFTKMGKNVVYLPAYYYRRELVPAANPFLLTTKGNAEEMTANLNKETVTLYTKFPLRTYVLDYAGMMLGGRFQLANKADLSDTVTVHTIKSMPFYRTSLKIQARGSYRYLIYQFKGLPKAYVSELEFYGPDKSGKEVKLTGKLIGNPGMYPYLAKNVNDDIWYNLFKARADTATYIGIDLGESNTHKITGIKYMPYSDDNAVIAGNYYELWYWKNAWISMGLKKASAASNVVFENIPKGALLLLKHSEGGEQQRVFIYRNGRQEFW